MMIYFLCATFVLAGDFKQLYSSKAESSSFLKSSWNRYNENYHPNYVLDNNPKTAWVEGVNGQGEAERILIPISSIDNVSRVRLKIRNGYQKSRSLLKANSAPKAMTIRLLSRTGSKIEEKKVTLKRKMGWQEVTMAVSSPKAQVALAELIIDSVHPGSRYKDTCISDIEVWAESKSEYKVEVEKHKEKQLLQWVANRVADAQYFANKPKEYPFADTQFHSKRQKLSKNDFEQAAKSSADIIHSLANHKVYFSRENKNTIRTMPDGLAYLPNDIWILSDIALFETKKKYLYTKENKEHYDGDVWVPESRKSLSNFKRATDGKGSVSHLFYTEDSWLCERSCYGGTQEILAGYTNGRLTTMYRQEELDGGEPGTNETRIDVYSFIYVNNKVQRVVQKRKRIYEEWILEEDALEDTRKAVEYFAIEYAPSTH
jgi:hypothetical protein